jgi:hypothetical protein
MGRHLFIFFQDFAQKEKIIKKEKIILKRKNFKKPYSLNIEINIWNSKKKKKKKIIIKNLIR